AEDAVGAGQQMPVVPAEVPDLRHPHRHLADLLPTVLLRWQEPLYVEKREPRPQADIALDVLQPLALKLLVDVLRPVEAGGEVPVLDLDLDAEWLRVLRAGQRVGGRGGGGAAA